MSLRRLNASVLSPLIAFPVAWAFAALLSQIRLLDAQGPWSTVMVAVVIAVPLAFLAGGLIGEGAVLRVIRPAEPSQDQVSLKRTFRLTLAICVSLGLLELAHQFIVIGGIPLLTPGGSEIRFEQGGPTIILINLLTVAAIAALVVPQNPLASESRFELAIAAIALGGFALQAGRGSVVLPVIVATAARWLYWGRPRLSILSAAGLFAFAAIVFGFYLRTRQNPYNPFEAELYGEILPGIPFFLQPLVPLYLAITTNFVGLQGVIAHFPTGAEFGGGVFNAIGLDLIFHSARNLSDVSASLTGPWVTSTMAGSFWADGGFALVVLGVTLTGFFSTGAFAMARSTRSLRWSMVAGYLLYQALFGLYTNLWTQQIDWLMVVPLLVGVGAIAENPESPPGLTGRALARIRRMNPSKTSEAAELPPATGSTPIPNNRLARRLILAGFGIVSVLVLSGLLIQRLLPEPYPLVSSMRLPSGVADANAIVTDGGLFTDNEEIEWIKATSRWDSLYSYKPGEALRKPRLIVRTPHLVPDPKFDVGPWPPWRAQALFSFQQRPTQLWIKVIPTWKVDADKPLMFRAPLSRPEPGLTRDFMLTYWSGSKPDLFVLTRGREDSRPLLQILSGESGFRKQAYASSLLFRGLKAEQWSVDMSHIADLPEASEQRVVKGTRPDLVLVEHTADRENSNVQVLLGESGYMWNAFQRDLDTPGLVPNGTVFIVGSHLGAGAIYEVHRRGPEAPNLRVFGIENPPGFK